MSESPFQHLSEEKFQEFLGLAKTVEAESESSEKVNWTSDEAAEYSKSDAAMALNDLAEKLSVHQRAELVALMQIGRGLETFDGGNWQEIYQRSIANGEHASYLTGTLPYLGGYLEKGLETVTGG